MKWTLSGEEVLNITAVKAVLLNQEKREREGRSCQIKWPLYDWTLQSKPKWEENWATSTQERKKKGAETALLFIFSRWWFKQTDQTKKLVPQRDKFID